MRRRMLKSKIHRATVTDADLNYVGSISIGPDLLEAADILEHEQVTVLDVDNGARFETYAIRGETGEICLNGAAARPGTRGRHRHPPHLRGVRRGRGRRAPPTGRARRRQEPGRPERLT